MKMFCTNCHTARAENEEACANCGAPSPLLGKQQSGNVGMGEPGLTGWPPTSNMQWEPQKPEISFENVSPTWQLPNVAQKPAPVWHQPAESQNSLPNQSEQTNAQNLLPVPYQNNMALQAQERQSTLSLQLIPEHTIQHLLPGQYEQPETTYVPPMYTEPRPLIPKYRIFSGLISVLIVTLLLCTGAGYYAQASGKLQVFQRFYGGALPQPVIKAANNLPDPPDRVDRGPAYDTIPSAVTTTRIDQKTLIPLEPQKIFQKNSIFYLTYSVQTPGTDGKVNIKWYTNNAFYLEQNGTDTIKTGETKNGYASMQYAQPAEGMVEIYWNNQLAERLYFVVR